VDAVRPEARLLLATAGGPGVDELIVRLAAGPIDWTLFLQLAAAERAEAIVSARLARLGVAVPATIRRDLKSMAIRSDLRMTTLSHRLDQTVSALANAGIPVVLLKGAALGRTAYGSLPRRPMLDLDLLIPEDRRREARAVALATDWVPTEFEHQVEFYQGHYHLAPLRDGLGLSFNLELHTALFAPGHPFDWPVRSLWERSLPLEGSPARVPAPEDLLLHIVLHFSWSHLTRFGPWRTFRDVRVLTVDHGVDWDRFTVLARASRGASAAYWTLRLARLFAGVAIPAEVERALRPQLPTRLLPVLDRHFSGQWCALGAPCPSVRLERWLWRLAVRPNRSGHGRAVPWMRDALFRDPLFPRVAESVDRKLVRHLSNSGRYLRYLHRLFLGIEQ
jgi:hypothetical protein